MNVLAGDDSVPVNLGLNAPTHIRKDVRFTFHTRRAVQSAIADRLVRVGSGAGSGMAGRAAAIPI